MRQSFVKMVFSAGVLVMLAGAPPAAWAANCLGVTGTQYRLCDFKRDNGTTGSYCTRFLQALDPNVFILEFPSGTELVCACAATGSFTAPNFAAGKDFLCFPNIAPVNDVASGKVVGQKMGNTIHSRLPSDAPRGVRPPSTLEDGGSVAEASL